ncbi:cytochrome P450 [Coniella lustricola]|uniref:Cytochrome P450 n=1 Tax=Coniella lustricola TaxID=2025994 RepID=A0A2T2ZUP8_9PEZI|nr:cytochrome P450 [Coniella lustricola]
MALTTILISFLALLSCAFILYDGVCLIRNYQKARKLRVPIRIMPINSLNQIWMLLDRKCTSLVRRLPGYLGNNNFTRYNWRGWELAERCQSHEEMGDVFIIVTPGRNTLYIGDPDAVVEVFRRSKDFPHDAKLTEMLDVFGPNISTALGDDWRKQRKITASCFNDLNNEVVWSESVSQAQSMVKHWGTMTSVASVADDMRTLTLNVMARAGFGQSFEFRPSDYQKTTSDLNKKPLQYSYRDSLQIILENCILIMALGPPFFAKSWLPAYFRHIHQACTSFKAHMVTVYEEAKHNLAKDTDGKQHKKAQGNLMASLVRASQEAAAEATAKVPGSYQGGLTEQEVFGNMFVFNFAGHDTTAHTFTFAIYFLAANPEVQDWISEEINTVFGDKSTQEWTASESFSSLRRCLAVLFETLRLYLPVPPAKWTENRTQTLTVGQKALFIPPQTMICPSYAAMSTDQKYWGVDALTWRPQRWIQEREGQSAGEEEMITPVRGTFLGWSEGARDCPGRKFSQVEFVATLAVLFKDWRVEPVLRAGETMRDAQKRVLRLIEEDTGCVLLIQMLHPEQCPLAWCRRTKLS